MGSTILLAATLALFHPPEGAAGAGAPLLPAADSVLQVRLVEVGSGRPVSAATVLLLDAAGNRRAGGFTTAEGIHRFSVRANPGDELRVERLGYTPLTRALPGDGASVPQMVELRMEPRPVEFSAIEARGEARCVMDPADAGRTYALWEATRIALQAAELTESEALARYRTRVWQNRQNRDVTQIEGHTASVQVTEGRPFQTLPPEVLAREGYVQETARGERIVQGPDARVLLSDAFASSHCFRVVEGMGEEEEEEAAGEIWVGLAFEPSPEAADIVRIGGTLWLDEASGELRLLRFQFMWYEPRRRAWTPWGADSGGTIRYRALEDGRWVVEAWSLRALSGMGTSGLFYDLGGGRRGLSGASASGFWYDAAGGRLLEVLDQGSPR